MNDLKKLISEEIEGLVPNNYSQNVNEAVMNSILRQKSKPQFIYSEKKDNIILGLSVIFCSLLVYFFGYSKSYAISVTFPKDFLYSMYMKFMFAGLIILLIINVFTDNKKKMMI